MYAAEARSSAIWASHMQSESDALTNWATASLHHPCISKINQYLPKFASWLKFIVRIITKTNHVQLAVNLKCYGSNLPKLKITKIWVQPDPSLYGRPKSQTQHPSFRVNFSLLWWMVLFFGLARFTAPHRNCVHKVFDEFSRYVCNLQPVEFLHQNLRRVRHGCLM